MAVRATPGGSAAAGPGAVAAGVHSWIAPVTPARSLTRLAASGSHFAYAPGKAERCTVWAARVTGMVSQPGTVSRRVRNVRVA